MQQPDFFTQFSFFIGGETEDEKVRVDILLFEALDFRTAFLKLCYLEIVSGIMIVAMVAAWLETAEPY